MAKRGTLYHVIGALERGEEFAEIDAGSAATVAKLHQVARQDFGSDEGKAFNRTRRYLDILELYGIRPNPVEFLKRRTRLLYTEN